MRDARMRRVGCSRARALTQCACTCAQAAGPNPAFDFYASFEVLDVAKDTLTATVLRPGLGGRKGACRRDTTRAQCMRVRTTPTPHPRLAPWGGMPASR